MLANHVMLVAKVHRTQHRLLLAVATLAVLRVALITAATMAMQSTATREFPLGHLTPAQTMGE